MLSPEWNNAPRLSKFPAPLRVIRTDCINVSRNSWRFRWNDRSVLLGNSLYALRDEKRLMDPPKGHALQHRRRGCALRFNNPIGAFLRFLGVSFSFSLSTRCGTDRRWSRANNEEKSRGVRNDGELLYSRKREPRRSRNRRRRRRHHRRWWSSWRSTSVVAPAPDVAWPAR